MLWCLLRSLQLRIGRPISASGGTSGLLVLEPKNGGGDVRVISEVTEIDQLKSKSDLGTWSLQSVISNVLPDLFLAVDDDVVGSTRFRLITEGRIGDWEEVYSFFKSFSTRSFLPENLDCFDETKIVPFRFRKRDPDTQQDGTEKPFYSKNEYSERNLFQLIEEKLLLEQRIRKLQLSPNAFRTRLLTLLENFDFLGNQTVASLQSQVDKRLVELLDVKDELPRVRGQVIESLIALATKGNCHVSVEQLFAECGLRATALSKWSELKRKCGDELKSILKGRKYNREEDVRFESNRRIADDWINSNTVLLITGDSGQGKSWAMASIAMIASENKAPVLWIDASGNAKTDLQSVADQFWLDARDGEHPIPFRQMINRINAIEINTQPYSLRVCIDNAQTYEEVAAFVRENWSSRKIGFVITCPNHIAENIEQEYPDEVQVIQCQDFTWDELHRYLNQIGSTNWADIRDSVRDLLRKPLLASIYRLGIDQAWRPDSERTLYEFAWRRLSTGAQSSFPSDFVKIELLGRSCFRTGNTHWDASHLADHGVENEVLLRLERTGWLIRRGKSWQIFHDRLLNWAIAQALLSDLRAKKIDGESILQELETSTILAEARTPLSGAAILGDLMWLSSRDVNVANSFCERAMEHAEKWQWIDERWFYDNFITSVGSPIASSLFNRFKTFAGYKTSEEAIINSLKAIAPERICEFAKLLLCDDAPRLQFKGLAFLDNSSCPELIDRIWEIHVVGMADPKAFIGNEEQDWIFRETSWLALKSIALGMTSWISNQIRLATSTSPCVSDLGWLLINSTDAVALWAEHADHLFTLLADSEPRVLVTCIGRFRDKRFLEWLKPKTQSSEISVSSGALHALSRINPKDAGNAVLSMDPFILEISASWALQEVLLRSPESTLSALLDRIEEVDDPWRVCRIFANIPNELPPALLSKTLDAFEANLANALSGDVKNAGFQRIFQMLQNLRRPSLVQVIEKGCDTLLPSVLAQYTIAKGPQKSVYFHGHERVPALELLRRMKSDLFCDVILQFLQHGNALAAQEAVEWGMTFPDSRVLLALAQLAINDDPKEPHFDYVANLAIKALVLHEKWEDAAHGIEKYGLATLKSVTSGRYAPLSIASEAWVDSLRSRLHSNPTAGSVLAIGFAGDLRDSPLVRKLLISNSGDESIRASCIIALKLLKDFSAESIDLVGAYMGSDRDLVVEILASCRSDLAWPILYQELEARFDKPLAIFMLRESPLADQVADVIANHLVSENIWFGDSEWHLIVQLPKQYQKRVLQSEKLRDRVWRDAYKEERDSHTTNTRSLAIRCLSLFDPRNAFLAAKSAFATQSSKNREHYPYLFMELDPEQGFELLFDSLANEKSAVVRAAIGGSIAVTEDTSSKLIHKFCSSKVADLEAACFLASWFSSEFGEEIKRCLDDEHPDVARTAVKALIYRRQQQIADEIATTLQSEVDFTRKCCLLDDLIATADLGESFRSLPKQVRSAIDVMHPFLKDDAWRKIQRRRKETYEKLLKEKR